METKYDYIVNFLLDNWFVAIMIVIVSIIMALPQLRDGVKMLWSVSNKKKKTLTSEYADEKITFEVKLRS